MSVHFVFPPPLHTHLHDECYLCSGRGVKRNPRILLAVTAAMYTATLVSWVTLLVSQFRTLAEVKSNVLQTYSWVPPEDCFVQHWSAATLPGYCTALPAAPSSITSRWDSTQACVGTGALTFNVSYHTRAKLHRIYAC